MKTAMNEKRRKTLAEIWGDTAESVALWDLVPEGDLTLIVVSDTGVIGFSCEGIEEEGEGLVAFLLRFFTPQGGQFHYIKEGADVEGLVNAFTASLAEYVKAKDVPEEAPNKGARARAGGWSAVGKPQTGEVSLVRYDGDIGPIEGPIEYMGPLTTVEAMDLAEDLRTAVVLAETDPPLPPDMPGKGPRRPPRHRTGGWVTHGDPESGMVSLERFNAYEGTLTPLQVLELAEDLRRAAALAETDPPVPDPGEEEELPEEEEEGGPDGDV